MNIINQPSELHTGNPHMAYARLTTPNNHIIVGITGPEESRFLKKAVHDRGTIEVLYFDENSSLDRKPQAQQVQSLFEGVIDLTKFPNL